MSFWSSTFVSSISHIIFMTSWALIHIFNQRRTFQTVPKVIIINLVNKMCFDSYFYQDRIRYLIFWYRLGNQKWKGLKCLTLFGICTLSCHVEAFQWRIWINLGMSQPGVVNFLASPSLSPSPKINRSSIHCLALSVRPINQISTANPAILIF